MQKPTVRERATALVSAIAAIAILGLAATAQPARTSPAERLARLESDLRYQLDLAARVDRSTKFDERTSSLDAALAEWRKSAQSPRDYEAMTDWLRTALVQSLPGESGQWPAPPKFSVAAAAKVHVVQKPIVKEPPPLPVPVIAKPAPPPEVVAEKPAPIERSVAAKLKPAPVAKAKVEVAPRPAPTPAQTAATYRSVKVEPVAVMPPLGRELGAERPAPKTKAPPPVQVNLAELNARVGGYHDGLREVEASLVASRKGLTVGQVAQMVGQLEQLAGQYQFVQLYYDALTRNERRSVTEPRSMAETVELVERERARVETADDDDFLVSNDVVEAGELAMRLKALAEVAERGGARCCD